MTDTSLHGSGEHYHGLDLETMKDESEGGYEKILLQLREWGRALHWPGDWKDGHWADVANIVEMVNQLTKPLIDRGLWVLVKITR
jgi:hypothetical protein